MMSKGADLRPVMRLSAFYAAIFLVTGVQLPFWPVWLASRGLTTREIGNPARRGDLFIVGSIGSGATLASSSGNNVLPVVLGASALVLLACLRIPPRGGQRACG